MQPVEKIARQRLGVLELANSLGDPLAIVAAFEAVCGLFIELILENGLVKNSSLSKQGFRC